MLIFSILSMNSYASTPEEQKYAGEQLKTLGILKGYPDGTLGLDKNITRAEIATMVVRMKGYEGVIIAANGLDFTDVKKDYWGYLSIQNAFKLNAVSGYPDKSFKPNNNITYAEMVAMMTKAILKVQSLEGEWPQNFIDKGKAIGVIPTTDVVEPGKIITRGEAAKIMWDSLVAKPN